MKKIFYGLCAILSIIGLGSCAEKEHEIKVYTRDTTSGTRDGFFTTIGFKDAVSSDTVLVAGSIPLESNKSIVSAIQNDEYGIGYISLATLDSSGLKGLTYESIIASEENVLNGSYKLTRNFNYIVRSEFSNEKEQKIVEAFRAYLGTKEGLATIKSSSGIVSLDSSAPSWASIKSQYPITQENNSNVTIKFGGSTSVESMSKALSSEFSKLCGNFIADHNHTGSGDAFKRTQGSEKSGPNQLHMAFASRDFSSTENVALGTAQKLCVDAIVAVVNKANSYTNTNAETLKKIYSGEIKKWSELE